VPTAADLYALTDRLGNGRTRLSGWPRRGRSLSLSRGLSLARLGTAPLATGRADNVRQRLEVVGSLLHRVWRQPNHVPATRDHQPGRVHLAQIP
jgi:hypothetical protein